MLKHAVRSTQRQAALGSNVYRYPVGSRRNSSITKDAEFKTIKAIFRETVAMLEIERTLNFVTNLRLQIY